MFFLFYDHPIALVRIKAVPEQIVFIALMTQSFLFVFPYKYTLPLLKGQYALLLKYVHVLNYGLCFVILKRNFIVTSDE